MKIGVIGAGKVGTTLAKYLSVHQVDVTGFYSKTKKSADEAATFTGTVVYPSIRRLAEESDVIFITTPDAVIAEIWEALKTETLCGRVICHFSGVLSSRIFSGISETGAHGVSIHPMYAFSDKFHSYEKFHTAYLVMEGDSAALALMKPFWEHLGHTVLTLHAQDKVKYHAAAALASNEMLGLMQVSLDLLGDCGFHEEDAMALLRPLVAGNVEAMLQKGCAEALTGPIERGDAATVRAHCEALAGSEAGNVYHSLAEPMLRLAARKHPDRDYRAVREALEVSKQEHC